MRIAIVDTLGLTYDGDTLSQRGLGGSESAVILIAQELAKIGFDVDVYNNCIDSQASPGMFNGVRYIDHSMIQSGEKYDIAIVSRTTLPFLDNTRHYFVLEAKHRVLWMHDTFCEGDDFIEPMLVNGRINEVITLSDFQTNYVMNNDHGQHKRMFEVVKHKFWQSRNGAVKWIDEVDLRSKDKNHFVYNASATKGLIPLLKNIWPEIKRRIPDAKLTCIGGFYRFREGAEPDAQEKTVADLMQDPELKRLGVTFTGVIPQFEIAKILANAYMMLYPSAFPETFGISSLESLLYKTPIVTNRFGALEETAIDLACYKIDYPSVPNGLFPHINEAEQARRFVDQVIDAYNNNYMYQQKQQYCSVVDDIYGWDTVALQWKQHFYTALFVPLSVEEYREATRITQKVNRVFGRRYNNTEDRNTYKSFGKQRSIVVVSPFWNASDYIESCIMSVAQQDYDEYMHILIDDASTDDSAEIVEDVLSKFSSEMREKFIFIRNDENKGAIRNQLEVIEKFAVDSDIVMLLDGDDCLMPNNTIFHYYSDLYQNGYEFTYGSTWSSIDNIQLVAQEYPDHVKRNKTYRTHMFNWKIPYTHLRTTLGKYFKNLDNSKFKDNSGNWMKAGADNPLFYELIEQVEPEKIYCNKEIIHLYNDLNPLNDYKIRGEEQNRNAAMSFEQPLKDESVNQTVKTILIAVPTNKYIEPETMKSIYDLIIPEGYQTRFEFFYGYQIDQIRNLIADWAKNYDYLLSVDSDIVLPNDILVKMIAADKDIITGLYIQRNPNQHILEVYQDRAGGGVENIPYWAIKDLGTIPVSACGFGCVLVKGEVFRSMEYPHFAYTSAIDHANTISEDIYFCNKARGLGFSIWCDTTIHCNHIGSTKFVVSQEKSTGLLLTDKMKVIPKTENKTNLAKTFETDLLPVEHVNYLYSMKASPKVIYDIGACLCHWQRHAKLAFPESTIILFDAEPEVEPYLSMSGCEHHIGVLTNEDEKPIKFYHDSNNPGGNSYYKENSDFFTEEHVMDTTGMTLDTIVELRGFPLPDMIKLDIQGAEIDVLRGATKTLANVTDIILEAQHVNYNEGAPNVGDVIMFMNSIGFRLVSNFCMHDVDGDYHFTRKS